MGDMAEDCGGYEVDYDPYEEGLATGLWTMRDGDPIRVENMTLRHLEGARRVAENAARRANFTCEEEKWNAWVSLFDTEIDARGKTVPAPAAPKAPAAPPRGTTVQMKCHCGQEYPARVADINRGWALSCSKRCAAIRRDFGRPPAKRTLASTNPNKEAPTP